MESSPSTVIAPPSASSSTNNSTAIGTTATSTTNNHPSAHRHSISGSSSSFASNPSIVSPAQQASNHTNQRLNTSHSRNISFTSCHHKALLRCNLGTQLCCACRDQRQHAAFYPRYVDGFGNVTDAPRWENYCSYCKVGWSTLMIRANVRPDNSHIPDYPPLTTSTFGFNVSPQPNSPPSVISHTNANNQADISAQQWHEQDMDAMEIDSSSYLGDGFPPTFVRFHQIHPDYTSMFDTTTVSAIRDWASLENRINGLPRDSREREMLFTECRELRVKVKDLVRPGNRRIGGTENQPQTPHVDNGIHPFVENAPSSIYYPPQNSSFLYGRPIRSGLHNPEFRPSSRTITNDSETFSTASSRRREVTERFDRDMENRQHQQSHPVLPPLPSPSNFHQWASVHRPPNSNEDSSTATSASDMDSTAANMGDDDRLTHPSGASSSRRESTVYSRANIRALTSQPRRHTTTTGGSSIPLNISPSRIQRSRRTSNSHNPQHWNVPGMSELGVEWMEPFSEPPWLRRDLHSAENGQPPPHARPVSQSDGLAGGVLGTREDVQRDDYESPIHIMFSNEWEAYRQNQERARQYAARELEVRNRLQEELRIQQALEIQQREQMHQQMARMQELHARQFVAEQALGLSAASQNAGSSSTSTGVAASALMLTPDSPSTSAATTPASNSRFHEEMESLDETDGESVYSPEEREERDVLREQQSNFATFEQQSAAVRAWRHIARQEEYPHMTNSSSSGNNNAEHPVSSNSRVGSRIERNRRIREQAETLRRGHTEAYREARDEAIRAANYQSLVNETLLRARPPTAIVTPIRNLDHNERPENLKDEDLKIMVDCKVCYGQVADMLLLPCAHLVLCQWCADTVAPLHMGHPERVAPRSICPVCRTKVDKKMKVFRC